MVLSTHTDSLALQPSSMPSTGASQPLSNSSPNGSGNPSTSTGPSREQRQEKRLGICFFLPEPRQWSSCWMGNTGEDLRQVSDETDNSGEPEDDELVLVIEPLCSSATPLFCMGFRVANLKGKIGIFVYASEGKTGKRPHFHARITDDEWASFDINTLEQLEPDPGIGGIRKSAEKAVRKWARARNAELNDAWRCAQEGKHPIKIASIYVSDPAQGKAAPFDLVKSKTLSVLSLNLDSIHEELRQQLYRSMLANGFDPLASKPDIDAVLEVWHEGGWEALTKLQREKSE